MYSVAWPANGGGGGGGRMINIIIINVYNNIIIMADNVPYTRYFYDKPHRAATDCDVYLENTVIGIIVSYYSEVYTHTYAHIIIIIVTIITYSAPSVALAPPGRVVCTTYLTTVRKKKKW